MSGSEDELREQEGAAEEPAPDTGAGDTGAAGPGESGDTLEPDPDAPAGSGDEPDPVLKEAVDLVEMFGLWVIEIPAGVDRETFAALPDCPVCNGFGKVPHTAPQDPFAQRCPDCLGHGVVITGSFVPGHEQRECPTCLGQGYTTDIIGRADARLSADGGATVDLHPRPDGSPPWPGAVWDERQGIWRDRHDVAPVAG